MKYILTTGWDDGVAELTERLSRELGSGQRVLWLVSGGSNVVASVQVMKNLSVKLSLNLGVMPVDERFGPVGHIDSNWQQLVKAGFQPKRATVIEVLQEGLSFEQTVARYNDLAAEALANYDLIVTQIGIGQDGHVAGILPGSPAALETSSLVSGYPDPPLQRLSLTFPALSRIHVAYAFAFGISKKEALATLQSQNLPPEIQPAQILKQLPEAYIYSDQVSEDG